MKRTMKQAFALLPIFAILLCGVLPACAQSAMAAQNQQAKPGAAGPYTLEMNTEEVVLNCTVLDNKGQLVNDLKKNNFKAFEDKVPQFLSALLSITRALCAPSELP
jgi:hypothetical protein